MSRICRFLIQTLPFDLEHPNFEYNTIRYWRSNATKKNKFLKRKLVIWYSVTGVSLKVSIQPILKQCSSKRVRTGVTKFGVHLNLIYMYIRTKFGKNPWQYMVAPQRLPQSFWLIWASLAEFWGLGYYKGAIRQGSKESYVSHALSPRPPSRGGGG